MILKKLCSILLALFLVVCTSPIVFSEEVVGDNTTAFSEIEMMVEEEPGDEAAVPTPAAETSLTTEVEKIDDIKIPLAKTKETWALINLIAMVVTVTVSLILTILGWYNRWRRRNIELDEEENEKYQFWLRNKILFRIINSALAIVSIIIFILTENIFLKLIFVDRFTLLMIAFAILAIGAAFFSKYVIKEYYPQTKEEEEEDDDNNEDEE